jgi:hypothetical protein
VKNLTKGWATSLIGLVLIGSALASVFTKGLTWVDASVPIALGIGLLFAPDPTIKKINKND